MHFLHPNSSQGWVYSTIRQQSGARSQSYTKLSLHKCLILQFTERQNQFKSTTRKKSGSGHLQSTTVIIPNIHSFIHSSVQIWLIAQHELILFLFTVITFKDYTFCKSQSSYSLWPQTTVKELKLIFC